MRPHHLRVRRARPIAAGAALCAVLLTALPLAAANREPAPMSIPGSFLVDAEGVIDLAQHTPGLVIIDARLPTDRRHGYLEGSISLPDEQTDCPRLAAVIPAPTAPVLFYCNGPQCHRSARAVQVALACGYSQVYWFRGGLEEWRAKGYPTLTEER